MSLIKKALILFSIGLTFLTGIDVMSEAKSPESQQNPKPNRLIHEKSPYLLQHAMNPVDWYPWGEEAFERSRKENKPVFLSIGYSTCHWCHVMEHESFSDPEVAAYMNEHFISIKVDREERPDIDQIYMSAVTAMTGSGGWPMSVFLTPEGKPFYGGTYYPPKPVWGRPSFRQLLEQIVDVWENRREEAERAGGQLALALEQSSTGIIEKGELSSEVFDRAFRAFENAFDSNMGGFESAPKFPRAHVLSFLLRYYHRTGNDAALEMVEKTLDEMAKGGIYDHLGGGFHRYSTDHLWRVPHFEKMLYDQAINVKAYLEAYQITKKPAYERVTREVLDYVLREMTSPEGAFYSAEDADSALSHEEPEKKVEGTFYVFETDELERVLGKEKAEIFNFAFGLRAEGNAGTGAHNELVNKNVLYLAHPAVTVAKQFKITPEETEKLLKEMKQTLFRYRSKRPRPYLDDKVMTDWNGLLISTMAFAGNVLNEPMYKEGAQKAADFILDKTRSKNGRLRHRYRDGEAGINGFLEDYAFFMHGLIDLYEATFDLKYLQTAQELAIVMIQSFWDEEGGGFFLTSDDAEKLITRTKEIYDGAIPSGNSVALLSLLRLGRLTMNGDFEAKARDAFSVFAGKVNHFPNGYPQFLIALDFAVGPAKEIILAGKKNDPHIQEMARLIYSSFIPNKVVALRPEDAGDLKTFLKLVPFAKDQGPIQKKSAAYVCENYTCQLPATELSELSRLIQPK